MRKEEWFETWFDSKYYHILYDKRDKNEAKAFLIQLIDHLSPKPGSRIMDMGCGKGRHAIQLASMGFDISGLDISEESITYARQFEKDNLSFYTHDMRQLYRYNYYDYIFSLFTSFGYFKSMAEHINVIKNNYRGLNANGIFVIDFLNIYKVKQNLIAKEIIEKKGIRFHITRSIIEGYITKNIQFDVDGLSFDHTEKVFGFSQIDLCNILINQGFSIDAIFGDYSLSAFDKKKSDRLIIVAKKK